MAQLQNKICLGCGVVFRGKDTARTCSARCRKRLSRAKNLLESEAKSVEQTASKTLAELGEKIESALEQAVPANEEGFLGLSTTPAQGQAKSAAPEPTEEKASFSPVPPQNVVDLSKPQVLPSQPLFNETVASPASPASLAGGLGESPLVDAAESPIIPPQPYQPAPEGRGHFYDPLHFFNHRRYTNVMAAILLVSGLLFASGIFYLVSQEKKQNTANQQATSSNVDLGQSLQNPTNGTLFKLNVDTTIGNGKSLTATGQVTIQNEKDSTKAFIVQNAAGNDLVTADTANGKVGIGADPTGAALLEVAGDISSNGSVVSSSGAYSLGPNGLSIGNNLVCTAGGCTPTNPLPAVDTSSFAKLSSSQTFTGSNIFKAQSQTALVVENSASSNTLVVDTQNNKVGIATAPTSGGAALQVGGDVNVSGNYESNGSAGASLTCPSGYALTNAVVSGGITIGGVCTSITGSTTPTFQQVYNTSSSPQITLSSGNGGLVVQDASTPIGASLLAVQSNGGGTKYLSVSSTGIAITGNVNTTGQYQINGTQISSSNLSDASNLALLNGGQTFTGANIFSNASNSFTGNGSGLTNVNAAQLGGQAGSYYTNATNIASGTLNNGRLNSDVALTDKAGGQTFTTAQTFSQNITVPGITTAGAALGIGASSASLNLTGSLSSTMAVTNGTNTITVGFSGVPTANITYNFDNTAAAGTYTICTSIGNCVGNGASSSAIGGSGSANTLAMFTNTGVIGNSTLTQSGSVVTGTTLNATSGYQVNSTAGSGVTCTGGNVLSNIAVSGGIITGGSCAVNGGGISPTLQQVYGNSSPATITLNNTNHGIVLQDAATPITGDLFDVENNAATVKYLAVNSSGASVTGTVAASTGYSVGGTSGSSTTCTGGNVLQNAVVSGGIVTGGTCVANGGTPPTLQNAYDNSSSPATITTSASTKGIIFKAGSGNDSTTLFQVQNAAGASLINADSTNTVVSLGSSAGSLGAWSTNANALPASRYSATSVTANGYIYVIGGYNSTSQSTVYYAKLNADGSTGTWTTNTNALPQALDGATSVVANNYVYVIGGENSNVAQSTVYYAKLNADGSTGAWQTNSNALLANRVWATSVTASGYVYVVGGCSPSCSQSTVYYAKLNADGSTGTWTTNTNALPAGRYSATSIVANGYVYIIGGDNSGAQNTVYYAKLNADGSTGTWTTNTNALPQALEGATSVTASGYVYVLGGWRSGAGYQSTVYYAKLNADGSTGTWTTNTNALPDTRELATSIITNGYVYVAGGVNSSSVQSTVYYASTSRVQVNGSLDLIGGTNGNLSNPGDQSTGSTGGSITAGNITAVGTLQVQGQGSFAQGLSANGNLTVGGSVLFQNSTNSTTAFQVQNAVGTSILTADTTNTQLKIGNTLGNVAGAITAPTIGQVVLSSIYTNPYYEPYGFAMGQDGYPRIAVSSEASPGNVSFYECTNSTCSTYNNSVIDNVNGGSSPANIAITVASDGYARAVYSESDNGTSKIRFARCTSANCSSPIITNLSTTGYSDHYQIQMAPDGFARIVYHGTYIQCLDQNCSTSNTTTYDASAGSWTSLAVGSDGYARIAYQASSSLKFIQCTNAACTTSVITTVDNSSANTGTSPSMAIGSDGYARILYYDSTNSLLKFAKCTNASCSTNNIVTIATDGNPSYNPSMALGSNDLARIAYHSTSNNLEYAYCADTGCSSVSFYNLDTILGGTSLILGSDGYARILYANNSKKVNMTVLVSTSGTAAIQGTSLGSSSTSFGQFYAIQLNLQGGQSLNNINITGGSTSSGSYFKALDSNGLQNVNLSSSGFSFRDSTDSTTAFQVQNSSGSSLLTIDTTNGTVTLANTIVKATSTTAFQIQSSGATNNYFLVDTVNHNVSIDNSGLSGTIQVGNTTGAVAQTINIGNNATASSTTTIVIGSTVGTSGITIQSGSGGITLAGHVITSGTTPTATVGSVTGTGASVTMSGNDTAGSINLSMGSSPTGGSSAPLVTVTFSTAFASPPRVVIFPANSRASVDANGSDLPYYVTSGTTSFSIYTGDTSLAASSSYVLNYIVAQ